MVTKKQIDDFLTTPALALAGVSRNPSKFGAAAFRELTAKGMIIHPINPNTDNIEGQFCFRKISELPLDVGGLIIMTRKEESLAIMKEGVAHGIKSFWVQRTCESKELLSYIEENNINAVTGECILMHYNAGGIHKFHRTLRKVFGTLPE